MKELIIDILKTHLPMVKTEIITQIADDILELKPSNPIDAVEVLARNCSVVKCTECQFRTAFGCGFKTSTVPAEWSFTKLRGDNNG